MYDTKSFLSSTHDFRLPVFAVAIDLTVIAINSLLFSQPCFPRH